MADRAYITPEILKWARETAKISLDIAASKVNKTSDVLSKWETGESYPTIKQAEKLAKVYKRPFSIFFLPEIPKDFQPLQDFRKSDSVKLTTASIFIMREIQQKQAWLKEVLIDEKQEKLDFVGKYTINDPVKSVAIDILKTLDITPGSYSESSAIKEWIKKAELNGIYISRTSFIHSRLTIEKNELQGFAIADEYAPFIFINSKDWDAPQLFTLVHELVHLWIAATGISNEVEFDIKKDKSKLHPIELFCNEVTANILMPSELIQNLDKTTFVNSKNVFKAAKNIGVSSFALIVRASNLGIISRTKYNTLRGQVQEDFEKFLEKEAEKKAKQKKQSGGPNPYLLRLNKNSRLFTQFVLDAFKGGRVAPTQASLLLNTPVNKFNKLEAQLY
jgi:Zn-dependent peptidase ImmA (M78 family)/DNA-binding XRE family transcriptional regulator